MPMKRAKNCVLVPASPLSQSASLRLPTPSGSRSAPLNTGNNPAFSIALSASAAVTGMDCAGLRSGRACLPDGGRIHHVVGHYPSITTRWRGRRSGNGLRTGLWRSKAATCVFALAAATSASATSSDAVASIFELISRGS